MGIYTKFGDKGKTALFGGKTVSKGSTRVEAYGNLDELNSFLGIVISDIKDKKIEKSLVEIQNDLFEIGSSIASTATNKHKELAQYLKKRVEMFEKDIDNTTKKLPELENFILPGGSGAGSRLHFARTIARRAERRMVALAEKEKILAEVLIYLNRLSDLLFTYARFINMKTRKKEIKWNLRD